MNEHQLAAFGLPVRPMYSASAGSGDPYGSTQLAASRNAAQRSSLLQAIRARRLALKAKRTTNTGQEVDRGRYTTAV